MIKRSTIDQVFDTARVEEVIGDFVQLKKSGSNYKALSPFTDERTPSFMVSPVKQIWKDFSSGKGGNVISFLMEHEHYTYPEAIIYLAKKYGIEIEETEQTDEEKKQAGERESMYLVSQFARDYFQQQLVETEEGKAIGLSYFKERGFLDSTLRKFELGYSPDDWEAFTRTALKKGYQLEFLEKTGLTVVKEAANGQPKKTFDRFKGRVMFPIHSMSGRVLGFGGRILTNQTKAAKYLNSPESEIYHKSKVLYGLYQAKKAIAKEDVCYLVEGYADVIQFYQNGVENTVASSGTALTSDQIRLINRLTKNIVILYDGDAAGTRASLRGIDLILEQGMHVKVCSFPVGEDPDSFAKNHTTEEIKSFLQDNAKDFIHYKATVLMEETQGDPIKKASVIRDMVESVAKIPDDIQQELYLKECQKLMDISEEVLYSTLAQIKAREQKNKRSRKNKEAKQFEVVKNVPDPQLKVNQQHEIERHLIRLLLCYGDQTGTFKDIMMTSDDNTEVLPENVETRKVKVYEKIYTEMQTDEIEFSNPLFKALYTKIMNEYMAREKLIIEDFINRVDSDMASEITTILMENDRYKLHRWDTQNIFVKDKSVLDEREVQQAILNLRTLLIKKLAAGLMQEMADDLSNQHTELLEDIREYKKLQVVISNRLGCVISADIS